MTTERFTREPSPSIPGISDSVLVSAGNLLYVSGVIGLRPDGEPVGDFAEEVDLVFAELQRALGAQGATFSHLARINVYIVALDAEKLATFRTVRDRWIDADNLPASTLIGVAALVFDSLTIEIDAVAAV
jgi:2-iminobutanoate/2-iminopropanoate deaminase